jgi:hypothetical protein
MGAPIEMWSRDDIESIYGYINSLIPVVREPSAEGTWAYNLPAGATTDDTRWKALIVDYLSQQNDVKIIQNTRLEPKNFASYIVKRYTNDIDRLKSIESFKPMPFENGMRRIGWLQEFALVARPFMENDLLGYSNALNKFYGGEMACAGMLFGPAIAACFPGEPEKAYNQVYTLDIFDIGNSKDMSGAAMISAALEENSTPASILAAVRDIDPKNYFKSRLVGRTAYAMYQDAKKIVHQARLLKKEDLDTTNFTIKIENTGRDSLYLARQLLAYHLLDGLIQRVPWHPAEIHLINLTALLFSDFDFLEAMEFIMNYGRDNDTTGAVTGAIIGAHIGANQLPQDMVKQVIKSNMEIEIDLEKMAYKLTLIAGNF